MEEENKKVKVKKKIGHSVPMNLTTKVILFGNIALIVICLVLTVLSFFYSKVADYTWYSFYTRISMFSYHLFSNSDLSKYLLIFGGVFIIVIIILCDIISKKQIDEKKKKATFVSSSLIRY